MKKILLLTIFLMGTLYSFAGLRYSHKQSKIFSQQSSSSTSYGNTLNVGVGFGYGKYHGIPLLINYEFDVVNSFTLAPFIGIGSTSYDGGWYDDGYWNNNNNKWVSDLKRYSYRETYIPIGVKGTYYFDELLGTIDEIDIYAAASLGFTYWYYSSTYDGFKKEDHNSGTSALYILLHLGVEYHFNDQIGAFLDASTGMSTLGVSFRL